MEDLFDWNPEEPEKKRTRADQILDAFIAFHADNPEVWSLFKKFTFEVIYSGRDHFSSKAIFERIRWYSDIESGDREVKLGNNFTPYYSRLFHLAFPTRDGFFRNRKLISIDVDASEDDQQFGNSGEPESEEKIVEKLSEILKEEEDNDKQN